MYECKTKPYAHQREALNRSKNEPVFALFMEQGTGKSKVSLDTAGYQFTVGNIDALIVIAPNGVHTNWIKNEIPTHLGVGYESFLWHSGKLAAKAYKEALSEFVTSKTPDRLKVFAMNVDAVATKNGEHTLNELMTRHRCMLVVDESTRIKSPSAKRTKTLIRLAKKAQVKRILTGTPITQGPLDLYTQMEFLGKEILGHSSYYAFRARYALIKDGYGPGGKTFKRVVGYRNVDELIEKVAPYSFRVTKDECLDLPAKVYEHIYVELSKEQRKLYTQIKDEFIAEFDGKELTAPLALTRLLRLQQIIGGFFPNDEDELSKIIGTSNPRMAALLELLEGLPEDSQVIIWARFRSEIELIKTTLDSIYGAGTSVTYYGATKSDERADHVQQFQDGNARFFIGNQHTAGLGLTLTAANTVIYYSNDFSLEARLQSEDRCHRIGQTRSVTYYDIEAVDTLDAHVIKTLT